MVRGLLYTAVKTHSSEHMACGASANTAPPSAATTPWAPQTPPSPLGDETTAEPREVKPSDDAEAKPSLFPKDGFSVYKLKHLYTTYKDQSFTWTTQEYLKEIHGGGKAEGIVVTAETLDTHRSQPPHQRTVHGSSTCVRGVVWTRPQRDVGRVETSAAGMTYARLTRTPPHSDRGGGAWGSWREA